MQIPRPLIQLATLSLVCLQTMTFASDFEIANVHCKGGWITQGDDKFLVIQRCGQPLMTDVISGSDERKVEKLAYQLGNSKTAPLTIVTVTAGKVSKLERTGN